MTSDRTRPAVDPEARLKALLSNDFESALRLRGWTPADAATATGMDEQDVAAIKNGSLRRFDVWQMLDALTRLGCDIVVTIGLPENERGVVHVEGLDDE